MILTIGIKTIHLKGFASTTANEAPIQLFNNDSTLITFYDEDCLFQKSKRTVRGVRENHFRLIQKDGILMLSFTIMAIQ